jgi:cysteine desulfurase
MNLNSRIYLDHAAGTSPCSAVQEKLPKLVREIYGNPSAIHGAGQKTRAIIDEARLTVAGFFRVKVDQVIFTSGATESLFLATVGHWLARPDKSLTKILVSPLAHSAVWGAVNFLVKNFQASKELLPIDDLGFWDLEKITPELLSEVSLVVGEHGNSEIGLIQPVKKLTSLLTASSSNPAFIVDVAASIVTEDVSLDSLGADFVALSGEKFGGLPGAGVLIKSEKISLGSLIEGSHEFGYRGGTENWVGIWALGEALKQHQKISQKLRIDFERFHEMVRTFFIQNFPKVKILTPEENYLPHIFHFLLPEGEANTFVTKCDLAGVEISAGPACSSGAVGGSVVLKNLKMSEMQAKRGVRLSWGVGTAKEELKQGLEILKLNL